MKPKNAGTQSEGARIAQLLRHAFDGNAWHGPALLELLEDVDAATAAARPLPNVHSIWELVLHIAVWDRVACHRLAGEKCQPTGTANFPLVTKPTEAAWRKAVAETKRTHDNFVRIAHRRDADWSVRCGLRHAPRCSAEGEAGEFRQGCLDVDEERQLEQAGTRAWRSTHRGSVSPSPICIPPTARSSMAAASTAGRRNWVTCCVSATPNSN